MPEGGAQRLPQHIVEQARNTYPVSVIVSRRVKLVKKGSEFAGLCPFHNEKSPSFTVNDDKGFFHCFGCGAHGDQIGFLMRMNNASFHETIKELLGGTIPTDLSSVPAQAPSPRKVDIEALARQRAAKAMAIWAMRKEIKRTIGEVYLRDVRKLRGPWPDSLAFHPALFYSAADREMPAIIAALTNSGGHVTSIQRIFLDPKTGDKAEPRREAKRTMGVMGDASVRLGEPRRILGIAEGIETGLAAKQMYLLPVWVSCGAQRMKELWIPETVDEVVIFRDAGETGMREAEAAADRHDRDFRKVVIEAPPGETDDFNTAVKLKAAGGNV